MPFDSFLIGFCLGNDEGRSTLPEVDIPVNQISVTGNAETIFLHMYEFALADHGADQFACLL